ncbi:hypothetical protein BSKO_11779 [Bryopsis sp. KO-2023]|nr:hypothetical protein BSKO_11779 [Bryopsis sp. KO-2023]
MGNGSKAGDWSEDHNSVGTAGAVQENVEGLVLYHNQRKLMIVYLVSSFIFFAFGMFVFWIPAFLGIVAGALHVYECPDGCCPSVKSRRASTIRTLTLLSGLLATLGGLGLMAMCVIFCMDSEMELALLCGFGVLMSLGHSSFSFTLSMRFSEVRSNLDII